VTLNPVGWCTWAIAAVAVALTARNPFVQLALALVLFNVWLPYRSRRLLGPLRLGLLLGLAPIAFSLIFSRYGDHVIFRLPPIPIIGGSWTWEALAFGATTGLALVLTITVFAIVQLTVRSGDLIAMLPPPLYRAGTVVALALVFAPQTVATMQSIAEARRLRGRRTGWRAAPALVLPLLLTTLERALQYGESLDARGYGTRRRSRYRPSRWRPADLVIISSAAAALLLLVVAGAPTYNAYQNLVPAFPPLLSLLTALLLVSPALVSAFENRHGSDHD
jgi:energy-coupling factor transport system permease protein